MSSHPYVSQLNTPLDDDTTLMSTTDLESYITHANDTFVQVSGYQLNELLAQPHNLVRPESCLRRYVVHPKTGRTVERHCEKPA